MSSFSIFGMINKESIKPILLHKTYSMYTQVYVYEIFLSDIEI